MIQRVLIAVFLAAMPGLAGCKSGSAVPRRDERRVVPPSVMIDDSTPEGVVNTYMALIAADDPEAIAAIVSSELQDTWRKASFKKRPVIQQYRRLAKSWREHFPDDDTEMAEQFSLFAQVLEGSMMATISKIEKDPGGTRPWPPCSFPSARQGPRTPRT